MQPAEHMKVKCYEKHYFKHVSLYWLLTFKEHQLQSFTHSTLLQYTLQSNLTEGPKHISNEYKVFNIWNSTVAWGRSYWGPIIVMIHFMHINLLDVSLVFSNSSWFSMRFLWFSNSILFFMRSCWVLWK